MVAMTNTLKKSGIFTFVMLMLVFSFSHLIANETETLDPQKQSGNHTTTKLTSSVSAEFRGGVHEKYLQYLADKLNLKLDIIPMTYNRRIASLRNGTIDIMVGLRSTYDANGDFVYLQPSYTSSTNGYFIKADGKLELNKPEDFRGLLVAVTASDQSYIDSLEEMGIRVVIIQTLEQKIKLLMRSRIDAFEHVERSALWHLEEQGLSEEIVLAEYESPDQINYYFAMSTRSSMMAMKDTVEKIIAEGVANGDFTSIRNNHYLKKPTAH